MTKKFPHTRLSRPYTTSKLLFRRRNYQLQNRKERIITRHSLSLFVQNLLRNTSPNQRLHGPPPHLSQLAGTNIPADESPALSDVDEEKDRQQKTKYAYILKVMFTETTWLQITVDDKPPRDALYKAGSRRIWRAREKIKLHIGNTGGVNLTLNGSPVASLGPSGHSTRITIPDDLPL